MVQHVVPTRSPAVYCGGAILLLSGLGIGMWIENVRPFDLASATPKYELPPGPPLSEEMHATTELPWIPSEFMAGQDAESMERVVVNLDVAGKIEVAGETVPPTVLRQLLCDLHEAHANQLIVQILADDQCTFGQIRQVIAICRSCAIRRYAVASPTPAATHHDPAA